MALIYLLTKVVCTVGGLLYPAYASFKALEQRQSEDLLTWLMFWIVMGVFTAIEFVADIVVFWFPFYYQLKMLFILWLILPQTQGSTYLYNTFIHPALMRHEEEIDGMIEKVQTEVKNTSVELGKRGVEVLQKAAIESIAKGQYFLMDRLAQQTEPESSFSSARLEEIDDDEEVKADDDVASKVQNGKTVVKEIRTRSRTKTRIRRTSKNDIVVIDENLSFSDRDVDDLMDFDSDSDTPLIMRSRRT